MKYLYLKQTIGCILLIFGIFLISFVLFHSYSIFTGKTLPPQIFNTERVFNEEEDEKVEEQKNIFGFQEIPDVEKIINKQFSEVFPTESIDILMNLISWSIFSFIFIFGGSQIAGIGIKIIAARNE